MFGRWVRLLLRFFRPLRGWKDRLGAFAGGQVMWPVPGRPDAQKVFPFPVEWTAVRVLQPGEGHSRGWEPLAAPCADCGEIVPAPYGVRCARCGVVLHELCAGMRMSNDVPACVVCATRVRHIARSA